MPLFEQYRPTDWSEVVGQDKVLATIATLRPRGLAGRAYWISGQSGTGKTTIARLLAAEVADPFSVEELDATGLTPQDVQRIDRECACYVLGNKPGRAYLVNEAHGLARHTVRQLLVVLERIPKHVLWCFTTTTEGEAALFDGMDDAHPLLSRCVELALSRRDLAKAFAERAAMIAEREGLNGQPVEAYIRLAKECRNNLREMLQRVEAGCMLAK